MLLIQSEVWISSLSLKHNRTNTYTQYTWKSHLNSLTGVCVVVSDRLRAMCAIVSPKCEWDHQNNDQETERRQTVPKIRCSQPAIIHAVCVCVWLRFRENPSHHALSHAVMITLRVNKQTESNLLIAFIKLGLSSSPSHSAPTLTNKATPLQHSVLSFSLLPHFLLWGS